MRVTEQDSLDPTALRGEVERGEIAAYSWERLPLGTEQYYFVVVRYDEGDVVPTDGFQTGERLR